MDQFGVLVESIGFKAQGKSAPMADLKSNNNKSGISSNGFPLNLGNHKPNSVDGSYDFDNLFVFHSSSKPQNYGHEDPFGGPDLNFKQSDASSVLDMDSVFKGSGDSFGDLLGNFGDMGLDSGEIKRNSGGQKGDSSKFEEFRRDSVNDLLRNFGDMGFKSNETKRNSGGQGGNSVKFSNLRRGSVDDLLGDFSGKRPEFNENASKFDDLRMDSGDELLGNFDRIPPVHNANASKFDGSSRNSGDDLLRNFGGARSESDGSRRSSGGGRGGNASQIDDLLSGFGGSSPSSNGGASEFGNDLESFFSMGGRSSSVRSPTDTAEVIPRKRFLAYVKLLVDMGLILCFVFQDLVFDTLFQDGGGSKVKETSSHAASSTREEPSVTSIPGDFSFLFGMGVAPPLGEFEEMEGESEERRRARLNHHLRTQKRMAKALDEKNQRDLQTQREQEERHRLAETLDDDIKRWAAGKEGNLRALLSSLQDVLWPQCGWKQVSLTDLITSISVKKVYYKATLCVHPDKVQQKGANLRQKYIAEKVFDLLKGSPKFLNFKGSAAVAPRGNR
ncbi:hypothetical protein RJ639_047222 [Escallonia herrerae]|uniref:Auxilin-related protein 1 n=1 Tax=Escallonia herrerae TaxID=1293975 RepID=A0AA88WF53_9ASTE|nr:hypothetical protein RJ639_047222 [Escallonia herrerae]